MRSKKELKIIKLDSGYDMVTEFKKPKRFTGIVEDVKGGYIYYKNGVYHREDGPAMKITINDYTFYKWYLKGKLHREDGPAIDRSHTAKILGVTALIPVYYLFGRRYKNKEEHKKAVRCLKIERILAKINKH